MPSPDRARFVAALVVLAAVFGAAFLSVRLVATELAKADLRTEQEWPDDVASLVGETWTDFIARFEDRQTCFEDFEVTLVRELDAGDARYRPVERLIEIRIPTSPRRFRESLVHELAHHVERTCAAHAGLRAELGYPEWEAWTRGPEWEQVPSERWAEAVVLLVNGERVRFGRSMPLDDAWIATIEAWVEG